MLLPISDASDVTDQPIRMRVRGSSSAAEYAKKSFSLDPVDQITNIPEADTDQISFLGGPHSCAFNHSKQVVFSLLHWVQPSAAAACFCAVTADWNLYQLRRGLRR